MHFAGFKNFKTVFISFINLENDYFLIISDFLKTLYPNKSLTHNHGSPKSTLVLMYFSNLKFFSFLMSNPNKDSKS